MKPNSLFLVFFISMLPFIGFSQDGSPDLSFGNNGTVQTDIQNGSDIGLAITQLNDERLIIGGGGTNIGGDYYPMIIAYHSNGTVDTSFGTNGVVWRDHGDIFQFNYVVDQNNKIVVGGGDTGNFYVLSRYLYNGDLDTTFGSDGDLIPFSNDDRYNSIVFQDDGSFIVSGDVLVNGIYQIGLKRYLADGDLDLSFGDNGLSTTAIGNESNKPKFLLLLENGQLIVMAEIRNNGITTLGLTRFLNNGTFDTNYGNNGISTINPEPEFSIRSMAAYGDGKVAVATSYFDWLAEIEQTRLFRYLPNGDLDLSFGSNGIVNPNISNLSPYTILVQENQRLLIFGEFTTNYFEGGGATALLRYHLNGTLDSSLHIDTILNYTYFTSSMALQDDGKIICVGNTPWYDGPEDLILERYHNNPLGVEENTIHDVIVSPNPSNGIFSIEYTSSFSSEVPYYITDVVGKVIQNGLLTGNHTEVDLSAAQTGMYFLTAVNTTLRLVKN